MSSAVQKGISAFNVHYCRRRIHLAMIQVVRNTAMLHCCLSGDVMREAPGPNLAVPSPFRFLDLCVARVLDRRGRSSAARGGRELIHIRRQNSHAVCASVSSHGEARKERATDRRLLVNDDAGAIWQLKRARQVIRSTVLGSSSSSIRAGHGRLTGRGAGVLAVLASE
jgi:hypothetical protein